MAAFVKRIVLREGAPRIIRCDTGPIYSFYSSFFGVPIAITFARFFYVWIAVQQRDRAALYVNE